MIGTKFTVGNVATWTAAAIVADQLLDRFIIRSDMNPGGLVPMGGGPMGIGLDDVARGVGMMVVAGAVARFMPK